MTNAEAKRWIPGSIADPSIHAIVQPIYIAPPLFPPGQRDFLPGRSGMRVDVDDQVEVPDFSELTYDDGLSAGLGEQLFAESVDAALEMMETLQTFQTGLVSLRQSTPHSRPRRGSSVPNWIKVRCSTGSTSH